MVRRLYFRACCFVLFFAAASVCFSGFYAQSHFKEAGVIGSYYKATFEGVLEGTAYRPFVFRQMLPAIARFGNRVVPAHIKTRLYNHEFNGKEPYFFEIGASPTARNPQYFIPYLTMYLSDFLFLFVALYFMYLVCRALDIPEPAAVLAPVILEIFLPYFAPGGAYYYDFPELALCALAVYVALKLDWWWAIPVAALGAWNKESFLLFIPTLYPFLRQRYSRNATLAQIATLSLACLSVSIPIRLHFQQNPGGTVEHHLLEQLHFFLRPLDLLARTEAVYALRALRPFTVFPFCLLVVTVVRAWPRLSEPVRRHAQVAALINIPLYVLFCWPGELRDLSLMYMAWLLILAVNLREWMSATMTAGLPVLKERASQSS
jgi:hypothetical protein